MAKVSDQQKRNAVARIINDASDYAAEAQRLQVSVRQIKRWVAAARSVTPEVTNQVENVPVDVPQKVTSPDVTPPGEGRQNPVLDKLLQEEGVTKDAPPGLPTKTEVTVALVDQQGYCVEAYAGLRAVVGSMLVSARFTPPLDPSSPEVLHLLKMGQIAETAIRANAPKLYPIFIKHAGTWGALAIAIGADAFGMIMGLEALAKSKGWVDKKKTGDVPKAEAPSVQDYAASLRPAAAPAPAAAPPAADVRPGASTIIDAPVLAQPAAA